MKAWLHIYEILLKYHALRMYSLITPKTRSIRISCRCKYNIAYESRVYSIGINASFQSY